MNRKNIDEPTNSSTEKTRDLDLIIEDLSARLIHDLNAGRGDYIEWRDDYLQELNGVDKFPNKVAQDMIRAGRGNEVFRHIDKFEPSKTLAEALLKDMLENGFYEDKDSMEEGDNFDYLLEDRVIEWKTFLSRFKDLDKSTALLVLKLLETNIYNGSNAIYKLHLGDCFNLNYFIGLDEEILKRLSERGVVIEDEDKNRFVGIDKEKWDKYTNIALKVQDEANEERDRLEEELNGKE